MLPDNRGERLGFIWLQPGVSRMNGWTLLYICFVSIGLLVFLNFQQPYILDVMLGIPADQHGKVVGGMALVHETVLILSVGPFGALADRVGRRRILAAGYLILTAGYLAYPFASSVAMLTGFRAIFAVGAAAIIATFTTVLTDYPQEQSRGKLVAVGSILNGLGLTILALGGGQLTRWFSSAGFDPVTSGRLAISLVGMIGLVSAVIVLLGLRGGRPGLGHERIPLGRLIMEGLGAARNPRIALAYAAAFTARGDVVVVGMYLSLWVQQAGKTAGLTPDMAQSRAGILLGVVSGTPLLAAAFLGFLNDRIDRVSAVIIAMLLAVIGYFAFGSLSDPLGSTAYLTGVILGIGQVASILAGQTLIGQEAEPRIAGSTLGIFNLFGSMGTLVGSVLGGYLYDEWTAGGPFLMMAVASMLVLVPAVIVRLRYGASRPGRLRGT